VTHAESLRLLRDVPGVVGSFLVDGDARVLARDLPAGIRDDLLSGVGRRADAALSAAAQPMREAVGVVLRFSRLVVFCTRAGSNVVLALCTPGTSTAAVKVAMQAIGPALSRTVQPIPPLPPPAPAPAAPSESARPASPPRRRRGEGIWG
jgi:predicted regulator of Ras-like GTPase activity (Roadblock/LC7/MglB family)